MTYYPSSIVCHLQFTLSEQQFANRNKFIKKIKKILCVRGSARYDQAKRINTLKALILSYHLRSTFLECFSKDLRKTIVITKDNSNNGKYSGEAKWTQENKPAVIAQKFRRE